MKQFLFLLLVGLLFNQCASSHSSLPYWEAEEHNSSQKMFPAIIVSPSQYPPDYFQDANNVIHQNDDNPAFMNMNASNSYYRIIKRYKNLPEIKYGESLKMKRDDKNERQKFIN